MITYSAIISACEKGQLWLAALEILRQERQGRQGRLESEVITYNASISACEKGQL